jgi:hypothetical protein
MRHVLKAWERMSLPTTEGTKGGKFSIEIENAEDVKGLAPIVSFTIQSDPIGEVGVNGCQAVDMLEYVKCLFESLNEAFHCQENEHTIEYIKQAIIWQEVRTRDRERRNVEGQNKK